MKAKSTGPARPQREDRTRRPASNGDRPSERFLIREVAPRDIDGLFRLSKFLDSVNFPHDRAILGRQIEASLASFRGTIRDPLRRQYMFVMEGWRSKRLAGTSMVFAQHGHPDAPHVFFDVVDDQRYSVTLGRHFNHVTLRLGLDYQDPTEIGALVLAPELRAFGLGRPLSYVRFLFIAMYRNRFRPTVIAELMPPLEKDGRSLLWEHLGKQFTGLTYQAADKLSQTNKEFIISLFPQTPIQASLLPERVRALIGQVGRDTRGVKRILEDIGFEYSRRIDPFDGGPHYVAHTDRITVIRACRLSRVARERLSAEEDEHAVRVGQNADVLRMLVGVGRPSGPTRFTATTAAGRFEGDQVVLTNEARDMLKLKTGSTVHAMPY